MITSTARYVHSLRQIADELGMQCYSIALGFALNT